MVKSSLLEFSYEDMKFKHHTADYYENKKFTFLKITIGILGFSAAFINIFKENLILKLGGLCLLVSSLLMFLYFLVTSKPSKELERDSKDYRKLTDKDILEINIERIKILSELIGKKQKVITNMTYIMSVGITIFCAMVIANIFIA